MQIRPYKCVYLNYQSLEDWTKACDILRCNSDFHGEPRNDCAILNIDSKHLICVRIRGLFKCSILSREQFDIALVQVFRPSSWKPFTVWDGCQVYDEVKELKFILVESLVRGALMVPTFDGPSGKFYFDDVVDYDMFLRAGN